MYLWDTQSNNQRRKTTFPEQLPNSQISIIFPIPLHKLQLEFQ